MARYWGADRPKGNGPKDVRARLVFSAMEPRDVERELQAADEVARIWRRYVAARPGSSAELFNALDKLAEVAPKDET